MQDHDISYWNSIQILIRDGLQIRPHEKDKYIFIDRKLHSSALGKPKRPLACVPRCPSIPQFWHLPFPWLLRSIPSLWTCGPLVPLAAANAAEPGTFTQPFVQCLLPVACRPARSSTLFWCYEAPKFISFMPHADRIRSTVALVSLLINQSRIAVASYTGISIFNETILECQSIPRDRQRRSTPQQSPAQNACSHSMQHLRPPFTQLPWL